MFSSRSHKQLIQTFLIKNYEDTSLYWQQKHYAQEEEAPWMLATEPN